ncbi:MAG: nuclear transport factor 2 family protein [Chloroflexota bacterium]
MAELSGRDIVERYARAVQEKDFDTHAALITDDYVDEMPQSGERVRGKSNFLAYARIYPGGVGTIDATSTRLVGSEDRWVLTPSFTPLRIEGSGDVYTYVGTIRYSNGETWQMIQIVELRQGKIAKTTSWYAAPFEAPEWRAPFAERFPALGT